MVNIIGYYRIHCEVEPKRQKLAKANRDLADANAKLEAIRRKLAALEAKVAALRAQFEAANSEKMKVEAEAAATNRKLNLAERLVNALASEKVRWKEGVATLKEELEKLVGDVLLSAAFLSYIGPFNLRLRKVSTLSPPFLLRLSFLSVLIRAPPSPLLQLSFHPVAVGEPVDSALAGASNSHG